MGFYFITSCCGNGISPYHVFEPDMKTVLQPLYVNCMQIHFNICIVIEKTESLS